MVRKGRGQTILPARAPRSTFHAHVGSLIASERSSPCPFLLDHNKDWSPQACFNMADWEASPTMLQYVASIRFHQRLAKCPRTGMPITYAVIGDYEEADKVILFVLPSGCSRWTSMWIDGIARRSGIKV